MLYFKNTELAKKYHVSLGTIRNWIEAAQDGKLDLALHATDKRAFIMNTSVNVDIMDGLVDSRKKFRNNKAVKKIHPKKELYELFTEEQIYDIATNLEINHEIPLQYSYFDGGAIAWDGYSQRLAENEQSENAFNAAQRLLKKSSNYLDSLLINYDRVNIVDIGAGNAMPAKWLIEHLLSLGKLGRYMAIDISPAMLEIAEKNVNKWFDGRVVFEGHEKNVNHDRFVDLLIPEYSRKGNEKTTNIVLHLGYTLRNMQRPENGYRTIYDSIGKNDLLIEDDMLDTIDSRNYFDFDFDETGTSNSLVPDLLSLDPSYYEVELGFDEKTSQRYERIRFKVAIEINIKFGQGTRVIAMNKGETILLWRNIHRNAIDILAQKEESGFSFLYSSESESKEFMLTISKIKTA